MSRFLQLYSRLNILQEAKASPLDRILPGFQSKARALATSRGSSAGTREGRLAMLGILFDLDIIDESVLRMFKNDSSVSRMVDYFEKNGISRAIKSKATEIEDYIKERLEDKISFTTGNRTDAAQQRYEVNILNKELKDAKKVARLERKKDTADALSGMSQTVDSYDDLMDTIKGSYSDDYMIEIVADRDSDLNDIDNIISYLKKFVSEKDIEVEGRNIDVIFNKNSKLAKLIDKIGVEKVEKQISRDLGGDAGVVIYTPDLNKSEQVPDFEDEEVGLANYNNIGSSMPEEEAEDEAGGNTRQDPYLAKLIRDLEQATGRKVEVVKNPSELDNQPIRDSVQHDYSTLRYITEKTRAPQKEVKLISFKERYKPKTSYQLDELRRYGL